MPPLTLMEEEEKALLHPEQGLAGSNMEHKLCDELSLWKRRAEEAEVAKETFRKEKERVEQCLQMNAEELTRRTMECSKLAKQVLEMDKELTVFKLYARSRTEDLLEVEEEMAEISSIMVGERMSHEDAVYVLKWSLALCIKHCKELKIERNMIASEEIHTLKVYFKAQEKIEMLETRLEERENIIPAAPKVRKAMKKVQSSSPIEDPNEGNRMREIKETSFEPPMRKRRQLVTIPSWRLKKSKCFR